MPQHIDWNCPATGRYYVQVSNGYYQPDSGTYQIRMMSNTFVIGGAIYTDLANPLTSGLEGVTVTVTGDGGTFEATTAGAQGLWEIRDVLEGTYTVTPSKQDFCFKHVTGGVPDGPPPITIDVNEANQQSNQSIQFLAEDCCVLFDMNYDGFRSLVGDVEPFVKVVYFNDLNWYEQNFPGKDPICPGDGNGDGFISIVGDVQPFVNCVYFGNCPE